MNSLPRPLQECLVSTTAWPWSPSGTGCCRPCPAMGPCAPWPPEKTWTRSCANSHLGARGVAFRAREISLVSGVDGSLANSAVSTAEYWRRLLRAPIRFADGVQTFRENGANLFLEVGPHPLQVGRATLSTDGGELDWLPGLHAGRSGRRQMLETLSRLYVSGVRVDWPGFYRDCERRRVELPTYPFQRETYWLTAPSHLTAPQPARESGSGRGHPLLGDRLDLAGSNEIRFQSRLSRESTTYLSDHRVFGEVVLPASAFLEIALAIGAEALGTNRLELRDVVINQPLTLPESQSVTVQTVLTPRLSDPPAHNREESPAGDEFSFQIFSQLPAAEGAADAWICHTTGTVSRLTGFVAGHPAIDMESARAGAPMLTDELYARCRGRGVEFGESFRTLRSFWRHDQAVLGHARLPDALLSDARAYMFHPALLDGGLHVLAAMEQQSTDADTLHLPVAISRFRLLQPPATEIWSHWRWQDVLASQKPLADGSSRAESLTVDLEIVTATGEAIAMIEGLQLKSAARDSLLRMSRAAWKDWLYRVEWRSPHANKPQPEIAAVSSAPMAGQEWLILSSSAKAGERAEKLVRRLESRGAACTLVSHGGEYRCDSDGNQVLDPLIREHFERLLGERPTTAPPLRGVVLIGGLTDSNSGHAQPRKLEDVVCRDCASLLHLVQSILETESSAKPIVWTISCGSQAVLERENLPGLRKVHYGVWQRQFRSNIRNSIADTWISIPATEIPSLRCSARSWALPTANSTWPFATARRKVARIAAYRTMTTSNGAGAARIRADASYLITGGLRGLGLEVATWMAHRGAGRLVLVGRTAPGDETKRRIHELRRAGSAVDVLQMDISDAGQIPRLIDELADGPPLYGVIHCAMVLDDGILMKQTVDRFRGVWRPRSRVLGTCTK